MGFEVNLDIVEKRKIATAHQEQNPRCSTHRPVFE
jgi:hypothetical protein